jgi:hypothetical protein
MPPRCLICSLVSVAPPAKMVADMSQAPLADGSSVLPCPSESATMASLTLHPDAHVLANQLAASALARRRSDPTIGGWMSWPRPRRRSSSRDAPAVATQSSPSSFGSAISASSPTTTVSSAMPLPLGSVGGGAVPETPLPKLVARESAAKLGSKSASSSTSAIAQCGLDIDSGQASSFCPIVSDTSLTNLQFLMLHACFYTIC